MVGVQGNQIAAVPLLSVVHQSKGVDPAEYAAQN